MKTKEEIITLIAEIEEELKSLEVLEGSLQRLQNKLKDASSEDRQYFLESAALELHNLYTGYEGIFEKIAGEINGRVPTTSNWHRRLLKNMALDIPEVRPFVITQTLEKELEEYLRFRHLVRKLYGFELEWERVKPLLEKVKEVNKKFREEIRSFLTFLKRLAEELQ